jgi:hypothetical protein
MGGKGLERIMNFPSHFYVIGNENNNRRKRKKIERKEKKYINKKRRDVVPRV